MKNIKIKCPAKINFNLKIINKREDGFHNIDSVMQTINLYDYLVISVKNSIGNEIHLNGSSKEIPYNETNLAYKAADLFLKRIKAANKSINVYIDKNIPVAAGLAGGSTDAAGTIFGLNKLFEDMLSESELHGLCSELGSDLNVCLKGGCLRATGRGEIIEPVEYREYKISLIKPEDFGVSAKEAYTKFSKNINDKTKIKSRNLYNNDLEWAIIDDYEKLKYIKNKYPNSCMTGSGSTYFLINENFNFESGYWVKNNLSTIEKGVEIYE